MHFLFATQLSISSGPDFVITSLPQLSVAESKVPRLLGEEDPGCHAPASAADASVLPLLWGIVEKEQWGGVGVGHCALSSGEVSLPQPGFRCAGSLDS
jgi:hypothetical protein